jgi:Putative adhesin
MEGNRRLATWAGAVLGAALALVVNSVLAHAEDALREEFHHRYPLSADGRVELRNVNGAVDISAWDQEQVQVDAVKRSETEEQLKETEIRVRASHDSISIETHYRDDEGSGRGRGHCGTVDYTLRVPRHARLDQINLVNGSLDVTGVLGEVRAVSVNGRLEAHELGGGAKLSTVNGSLEAQFSRVGPIDISSVNGSIDLTLPSDTKANVEATTVHGSLHNDFGLATSGHGWMGHELRGQLGGGGSDLRLNDVNGSIEIHRGSGGAETTSSDK